MAAVGQTNRPSVNALKAADKLLKARASEAKLTKAIAELHNRFEFGRPEGERKLRFTPAQLRDLELEINQLCGENWRSTLSLSGDRTSAAKVTPYEKLAKKKPNQDKVLFYPSSAQAAALGVIANPPFNLHINWQQIPACNQILIVENLDSFDTIRDYLLPPSLQDCPVLYRGHSVDNNAVKALIAKRKPQNVIWFGDWDPAGLRLATEYSASHILWPSQFASMLGTALFTGGDNEQAIQRNAAVVLNNLDTGTLSSLWQQLQQHGQSYMQQQALAHSVPLNLISL